jgi:hypothetical protein
LDQRGLRGEALPAGGLSFFVASPCSLDENIGAAKLVITVGKLDAMGEQLEACGTLGILWRLAGQRGLADWIILDDYRAVNAKGWSDAL